MRTLCRVMEKQGLVPPAQYIQSLGIPGFCRLRKLLTVV